MSSSDGTWARDDRRRQDRRGRPTRIRDSFRSLRQRRRGRRGNDESNLYVDRYTRGDAALLLSIFSLNIVDAFFTLEWIGRGGLEGNPLMAHVIQLGPTAFLFQKIALAACWLLMLTIHKNFRVARIGLWVLFGVYASLALYHMLLFFFSEPMPPPVELSQLWELALRASSLAC